MAIINSIESQLVEIPNDISKITSKLSGIERIDGCVVHRINKVIIYGHQKIEKISLTFNYFGETKQREYTLNQFYGL